MLKVLKVLKVLKFLCPVSISPCPVKGLERYERNKSNDNINNRNRANEQEGVAS